MLRFVFAGMILLMSGHVDAQAPAAQPPSYFRDYVVAVCAAAAEISEDCLSQGMRHSAYALSEMYLRAYREQPLWNSLRVRFPHGWVEASQRRFLVDLEQRGLRLAKEQIGRDIVGLVPVNRTEMENRKLDAWMAHALAEASDGRNWTHDWSENRHDFAPAHAVRQLAQADLRRWRGQ